ncbi:restriction endonuclease subunit S [Micromonospora haikouensis]|uniref:restriction endonuclease subunit S n=1 Tax=Micromonospora haikouensis TaxID=686309 RepID=UPI0036AC256F
MTGPLWGALPDGWLAGQVKNAATVTLGKMLQSKDSGSDVYAPYMRAANVQPDGVLALDDVNEMWFGDAELEQLSIRAGDVVVVEGGQGGFGRAAYVDEDLPGWGFQNSINRLRPLGDFDGRFIAFYLIALRASGFIRAYSNVVSMPHLTAEKLARIPMPLPPLEEQRAIADYLDRDAARIDMLIEEQQRLIDMLRERRRAVISSALTPTGSWVRRRIKHIGETTLGKMLDAGRALRDGDQPRPYVRAADVRADGSVNLVDLNQMPFSDAEMEMFDLRASDVLLIEGGATVGRPGFIFESAPGIAFQKTVNRLRVGSQADARFVYWSMLRLYESAYYANHYGSVSFVHLTGEKLREIEIHLPPLDEQRAIAVYLDERIAKIDALTGETERFIELARERRAALIAAAVTGQIDVREMA